MNSADARRLQRVAEKSYEPADWRIAADAWRKAGFEDKAEACEVRADELEKSR